MYLLRSTSAANETAVLTAFRPIFAPRVAGTPAPQNRRRGVRDRTPPAHFHHAHLMTTVEKGGLCLTHHDARTAVSISQTARPPPASNLGCAGTDRQQPTSFLAKARSNGSWILIPGPTWSSLSPSRGRMTRSEALLFVIPCRHTCLNAQHLSLDAAFTPTHKYNVGGAGTPRGSIDPGQPKMTCVVACPAPGIVGEDSG